jgi:hypothetical protein
VDAPASFTNCHWVELAALGSLPRTTLVATYVCPLWVTWSPASYTVSGFQLGSVLGLEVVVGLEVG